MIRTVRVSCPNCGDIELTSPDITISICTDDDSGEFSFECIHCEKTSWFACGQTVTVDTLVAAGATMKTWSVSPEMSEHPTSGEPISHDDILDCFVTMDDDELWAEALKELEV